MKYFLDTEFIEDGRTIDLVSIGIVAADGRELYLQNVDCHFELASDWVARNVYPSLAHFDMARHQRTCFVRSSDHDTSLKDVSRRCADPLCPWRSHVAIRDEVKKFCETDGTDPQFWAYYADYDWVVFCQLFGRMIDLPHGWPMYCRDLKQLTLSFGNLTLPKQEESEHRSPNDARWVRDMYMWLQQSSEPFKWPL